jgi:hypothetical protein
MEEEKEFLKKLVRDTEIRYLWYKNELQSFYKSGLAKEYPDWMKHLKEMEKIEEKMMKDYREEIRFLNSGLNPPFCYPLGQRTLNN